MGNSLPLPCVRHREAEGAAAANSNNNKRRRKQKSRPGSRRNGGAVVRPGHVVPVADTPPEDGGDGGEEEGREAVKEAWRPRPGCRVEPAGCGGEAEEDGGVRRVRIVMRRKDIAELVARLEQRDAAERDAAAMAAELISAGLGGDGDVNDGGRVTMSPCRDAWRPRLSVIPEHY